MIITIVFACLIIFSISCRNGDYEPYPKPAIQQYTRYGPIMLQIDDEWKITEGEKSFIRLAINDEYSSEYPETRISNIEFSEFAPKHLSIKNSKTRLYDEVYSPNTENDIAVETFDIPFDDTNIWIDLYFVIHNLFRASNTNIITRIIAPRGLYVYHPKQQKWWCVDADEYYYVSHFFDEETYNGKYVPTYSTDLLFDRPAKVIEKCISDRTFHLPSLEFFNMQEKSVKEAFLNWYLEKQ